jgi:hypothetical protein
MRSNHCDPKTDPNYIHYRRSGLTNFSSSMVGDMTSSNRMDIPCTVPSPDMRRSQSGSESGAQPERDGSTRAWTALGAFSSLSLDPTKPASLAPPAELASAKVRVPSQHMCSVPFNRANAEVQVVRDDPVRATINQSVEHFALTRAQLADLRGRPAPSCSTLGLVEAAATKRFQGERRGMAPSGTEFVAFSRLTKSGTLPANFFGGWPVP